MKTVKTKMSWLQSKSLTDLRNSINSKEIPENENPKE